MRVGIPDNVKDLLDLAALVYTKHQADGQTSVLNGITDHNRSVEGPKIANCLLRHKEAEDYKGKMEQAYKERDLLLPGIEEAVKASRDVLTGINRSNMKRMSDWGFSVIESAKATTAKTNGETK